MAGQGREGIPPQQSAGEGRVPGLGELVAGKYRVERVLGQGGMGAVLSARHEQLGQAVALKVLHPTACESEESVARFMREAQLAAALESDHVVRIFDVGTLEDGVPFMVMERLLGEDLGQVLERRGPLPVEAAVECVYQATLGVADAHAAGFVHRDLKPSNLFLTRRRDGSAWVKVLDFGISKAMTDSVGDIHLTRTRTIVGSPLYMSPEQVRNSKRVDLRSDLWSLGVILHELLSGKPPFDGETLPGVCARIAADPPDPLGRDDVPDELRELLDRCLQKDPDRRFGSALELSEALAALRSKKPIPFALLADENLLLQESLRPSRVPPSAFTPPGQVISSGPVPTAQRAAGSSGGRPVATVIRESSATPLDAFDASEASEVTPRRTLSSEVAPETSPSAVAGGGAAPTLRADAPEPAGRRRVLFGAVALVLLGLVALGAVWTQSASDGDAQGDEARVPVVRIETTPSGAEVWADGTRLGTTPFTWSSGKALRLQLRLADHAPYDLDEPAPERDAELRIQLLPLAPAAPAAPSAPDAAPGSASDGASPEGAPPESGPESAPGESADPAAPVATTTPRRVPPRQPAPKPSEPPAPAPRPADDDFGIRLKR